MTTAIRDLGALTTMARAQAGKATLDRTLEDWRARRTEVTDRLTAARARDEALAVQAAAATLEGADPRAVRKERAAVRIDLEELELALAMADEKLAALAAQQVRADRAVALAVALDRLDAVHRIATGVDETWAPMLRGLEALVLAHQDMAAALRLVRPGYRFEIPGEQLVRVLLWRAADLLGLPFSEAVERVPLAEFLGRSNLRAQLEAELAALTEEGV